MAEPITQVQNPQPQLQPPSPPAQEPPKEAGGVFTGLFSMLGGEEPEKPEESTEEVPPASTSFLETFGQGGSDPLPPSAEPEQPPSQPPVEQPPSQPPVEQPPTQPPSTEQPPSQPPVEQPPSQPVVQPQPLTTPIQPVVQPLPPTQPPIPPPVPTGPPPQSFPSFQPFPQQTYTQPVQQMSYIPGGSPPYTSPLTSPFTPSYPTQQISPPVFGGQQQALPITPDLFPQTPEIKEPSLVPDFVTTPYKIGEQDEEIDEADFFDEIEEPVKSTSLLPPPPSQIPLGDVMGSAIDKISRGEIFEGEPPVSLTDVHDSIIDMLPWWGWAIIFFLLGAAFVAILYMLFAPEEPRPTPQPPTPEPPTPAPPKPAPPPPFDPTRRIYCLIGEDGGRKVVIRVSDPSLCRKTIELTDEEYENSL